MADIILLKSNKFMVILRFIYYKKGKVTNQWLIAFSFDSVGEGQQKSGL